jgi:hypothetical protein
MRVVLLILLLVPTLHALDITTLDAKTYRECRVARVYPDSICVLFSGGGARIPFSNLPEGFRAQYGYDPQRAAAFQRAEADRAERERVQLHRQRQQLQAQARTQATPPRPAAAAQPPPNGGYNSGSAYVGVRLTTAAGGGNNQNSNTGAGGFGRRGGAQYVGVRMAAPGGIYGVTVSGPAVRAAAAAAATFNNP